MAVPLVVVRQGTSATLLHRQPGLGAVERLYLRLLVDREHNGVGRRVDVKADDFAQFGDELRVLRQLEPAHPVRSQPVRLPDPLHRRDADADRPGHQASGPMRRFLGRIFRRQGDNRSMIDRLSGLRPGGRVLSRSRPWTPLA